MLHVADNAKISNFVNGRKESVFSISRAAIYVTNIANIFINEERLRKSIIKNKLRSTLKLQNKSILDIEIKYCSVRENDEK